MNSEAWLDSFQYYFEELDEDEVSKTILRNPYLHEFETMSIHKMYGIFKCVNCKKGKK